MYDSEYFRKVIGDNYNPNELYNTLESNEEANVQTVIEPTYNVNNIKTNSALEYLHNMNNTEETSTNLYNNMNTENVSTQLYNTEVASTQQVNTEPVFQELHSSNRTNLVYPEIYNTINPMVDTILKNTQNIEYNEATINSMSTEIYNALEVDINPQKTIGTNTIQVNANPKNYLLHDLIKIMLISKIEKGQ